MWWIAEMETITAPSTKGWNLGTSLPVQWFRLSYHWRGHGFDLWLGNYDPACCAVWPKEKKKMDSLSPVLALGWPWCLLCSWSNIMWISSEKLETLCASTLALVLGTYPYCHVGKPRRACWRLKDHVKQKQAITFQLSWTNQPPADPAANSKCPAKFSQAWSRSAELPLLAQLTLPKHKIVIKGH